jgi:hypothetical protein
MTEPEESTWRVRMGCSLLQFTPMSDERRQAFDREAERERVQAEFEEQQRREAAIESAGTCSGKASSRTRSKTCSPGRHSGRTARMLSNGGVSVRRLSCWASRSRALTGSRSKPTWRRTRLSGKSRRPPSPNFANSRGRLRD